ncbi:MAG: lysophospholipid acyltransferase family protein [Desulfohalobiaceae bacterium]
MSRTKSRQNKLQLIGYEALNLLGQSLSWRQTQRMGSLLGHLFWRFLPGRRNIAARAAGLHLGLNQDKASSIAKSSLIHSGRSFLDPFLCRRLDHRFVQEHIEFQQPENFHEVVGLSRPVVGVTGHFGAWELLAGILGLYFSDRPAQIIVRQPKNHALSQTLTHLRSHAGLQVVHNQQSTFTVLRSLKRQGISAFLVDHNCGRSKAIFLPFLQKYAAVNMGPAMLALRARAVVWPVFLARGQGKKYLLYSGPCLDTAALSGDFSCKMQQVAAFYTRAVEEMVLKHPEQWFWMHRRWKTRPAWEKKRKAQG